MKSLSILILFSVLSLSIKAQMCAQTGTPNYTFYPGTISVPSFTTSSNTLLYLCSGNTIVYDTLSPGSGCKAVYVSSGAKFQTNNTSNCTFANFIFAKSTSTVILMNNAHGAIYYEPGATIIITSTNTGGINQISCPSISFPTVDCVASGIEELHFGNNGGLTIYPNPVNGILNVEAKELKIKDYKLKIYDTIGQLIREEEITLKENKALINTKELPNGMYVLTLQAFDSAQADGIRISKRLVVAQ